MKEKTVPVVVRSCDQCRFGMMCKYTDTRNKVLSEISKKTDEYFGALPEWATYQNSQVLIHCEEYLYKYSEKHCRDCTHCQKNPLYTGRRDRAEHRFKYICDKHDGWYTSGNTNPCDEFKESSYEHWRELRE